MMAKIDEDKQLSPAMDPGQKAFEIHSWPFYHLARLTALYTQRMDASLKPLGIDVPRWRVLAILEKNGTSTVTQLSGEAVSKISTMAKIVQRMIAEGLVTAQPSVEDARSIDVTISQQGRAVFEIVQEKVSRIGRQALHDVSQKEVHLFNDLCARLYANLAP